MEEIILTKWKKDRVWGRKTWIGAVDDPLLFGSHTLKYNLRSGKSLQGVMLRAACSQNIKNSR